MQIEFAPHCASVECIVHLEIYVKDIAAYL